MPPARNQTRAHLGPETEPVVTFDSALVKRNDRSDRAATSGVRVIKKTKKPAERKRLRKLGENGVVFGGLGIPPNAGNLTRSVRKPARRGISDDALGRYAKRQRHLCSDPF
ncbi:DNA gyrase subunit B [Anopheles sinensis]|uniref:DNA gyrase subunit B n=1 Tax=Anopheles sinensis TaxID=74873 RepID=A0A084VZN0_ANOSI|nr:DNA gyrase subunit B [Anopheles sinensis]